MARRKTSAPLPSSRDADLPALLDRLRTDNSPSALDQRRGLLLQGQLVQMERQLLVLNEAAAQRRALLADLCEQSDRLAKLCRQAIAQEVRGPVVPVERAKLVQIVERCGLLQAQLSKQTDDLLDDRLHFSSLIPNRYTKAGLKLRDLTASSHGLAFLNLGRVRALEGQLVSLSKSLVALTKSLEWLRSNSLAPSSSHDRHHVVLTAALEQLPIVTREVSELSVLVPGLPAPPSGPPTASAPDLGKVAAEEDVRRFLRDVRAEARAPLEANIKAQRQRIKVLEAQKEALEAELAAREATAATKTDAVDTLVEGLRGGYDAFRSELRKAMLSPLEAVLTAYEVMEAAPDNVRLKAFLATCQEQFPLLRISLSEVDAGMSMGDPPDPLFDELRSALLKKLRETPA